MRWKLTVNYMGAMATEIVSEAELADVWTFVQLGEAIGKCDGGQFDDEDGQQKSPLDWKDGRAAESGCGPWWKRCKEGTVAFCDFLLGRAGLAALVHGAMLAETFDIDGPNSDALDALDRADWTLEALPDVR